MGPSCPRDGYVLVFRPVEDQRRRRYFVKPVDEVATESPPPDLVPLPGSPSLPRPRFFCHLEDLVHEFPSDSPGIVENALQAPLYHPTTSPRSEERRVG